MPATFFVGDPHLFHESVARLRGFEDIRSFANVFANKWKKQVKAEDTVIVTGDCSGGGVENERRALLFMHYLPGHKQLISGNHDSTSGRHRRVSPNQDLFNLVFEKINDYGHVNHEGKKILISHYPYWASRDGTNRDTARYEELRLPDLGHWLIHAHSHATHPTDFTVTGREICTSWDAWHRLVDMGDIARIIREAEASGNPDRTGQR